MQYYTIQLCKGNMVYDSICFIIYQLNKLQPITNNFAVQYSALKTWFTELGILKFNYEI